MALKQESINQKFLTMSKVIVMWKASCIFDKVQNSEHQILYFINFILSFASFLSSPKFVE